MTLVEVMIGFLIIGMAALSALSAILFSWRLADSNMRAVTAMETARSIAEQILVLDYDALTLASLPVDVPSSPDGSLMVGAWNSRTDDVHNTPANTADDLILSIMPKITMSDDASGVRCAQIIVRYSWEEHSFFTPRTREDSITLIRSPVSAY